MKTHLISKTTTRVEDATAPHINERIHEDMSRRIESYRDALLAVLGER